MPFRYVKGTDGRPIMPDVSRCCTIVAVNLPLLIDAEQGMVDLIVKDSAKSLDDLL